jgi:uncharacterized protein YukE
VGHLQNNVRFDFTKSQQLSSAIKDSIGKYSEAVMEIKKEIASMGSWWKGPSQDGFMEYYEKISPILNDCENALFQLLSYANNVSSKKNDLEKRAKKRF